MTQKRARASFGTFPVFRSIYDETTPNARFRRLNYVVNRTSYQQGLSFGLELYWVMRCVAILRNLASWKYIRAEQYATMKSIFVCITHV